MKGSVSSLHGLFFAACICAYGMPGSANAKSCSVRPTTYRGWSAQEIRNEWVSLTLVPRLGGRLMQVAFGAHEYLFVNKQYEGKYMPPLAPDAPFTWYNYGGDKIWPLPEGKNDAKHWPGPIADALDDGDYAFSILSQGAVCRVRLDGPADARTGLQYMREISLSADSPRISFHAVMKNASPHEIEWSVQSVSQYNTADASGLKASDDIWAFAASNEHSAFDSGYLVRSGKTPAALGIVNGLITLNYRSAESETWFDTQNGWLAVVDGATQYAMVEKFRVEVGREYPGRATVIFYTNDGKDFSDGGLYYMEAEVNSPMVRLEPGEMYAMDTEWFPTRAGRDFLGVTEAGAIVERLHVSGLSNGVARLEGAYGVFYAGKVVAEFVGHDGKVSRKKALRRVTPRDEAKVNEKIAVTKYAERIVLRLVDSEGHDRGVLDQISLASPGKP